MSPPEDDDNDLMFAPETAQLLQDPPLEPWVVLIVDDEPQVHEAMTRAGWIRADDLSFRSGMHIVSSTVSRRACAGLVPHLDGTALAVPAGVKMPGASSGALGQIRHATVSLCVL